MRGVRRSLRVLITAGPTRERLDPVRFLSNYSTGYMGTVLARQALRRGHRVTLISGPGTERPPAGAQVIAVEGTQDMERALRRQSERSDVVVMAAAVSDFRPRHPATAKLPRRARLTLTLEATPDLLARLPRTSQQVVVAFALETGRVMTRAQEKLRRKRVDLLLAQQISGTGAPFGRTRVDAWLLARDGSARRLGQVSKPYVARTLLDKIEALWYGQRRSTNSPRRG